LTIPEIAAAEGLSVPYVGKLMGILRQNEFVQSVRGQSGGYVLSRPASEIHVGDVLASLGGRLFDAGFCDDFTGLEQVCMRSIDCSIRSLWRSIQQAIDGVLSGITLESLLCRESEMSRLVGRRAPRVRN
jgi:Rrf2 family protein